VAKCRKRNSFSLRLWRGLPTATNLDCVCAAQSGSHQNGDQFGGTQCLRPALNEPFAGSFSGGLVFEPAACAYGVSIFLVHLCPFFFETLRLVLFGTKF
jgi:hypothetical protein